MGIEKRPIERFNFYTVQPYTQTLVGESVGSFFIVRLLDFHSGQLGLGLLPIELGHHAIVG